MTTQHGDMSGKTQTKDVNFYNLDVISTVSKMEIVQNFKDAGVTAEGKTAISPTQFK